MRFYCSLIMKAWLIKLYLLKLIATLQHTKHISNMQSNAISKLDKNRGKSKVQLSKVCNIKVLTYILEVQTSHWRGELLGPSVITAKKGLISFLYFTAFSSLKHQLHWADNWHQGQALSLDGEPMNTAWASPWFTHWSIFLVDQNYC